mmetsp:Transcript_11450/g.29772  ORF Transcript_11450/g.29772 Transcript_11450/m.29772 type:complete len:195 (+) Transcript_11450:62-646(+)|eukprot:CAMPEP_0119405750 /NCGR_PEP_ID=MMETSP1335-20130426/336_1 /TAXON_ID=259385 /ORGANISM="Chrysoculter rhomboideus, Strain RCC1486" /LENGTH=194 /DNA_ID=CAMNT_0007429791 /DNA_START=56 /DNA_END=640 /DNA_ORIENTATION=+
MLQQIKATFGTSSEPTHMPRAAEVGGFRQTTALDRVKQRLGLQEKSELQELQESMCPALTYEQRFWGFAACFCAGVLLSITSMFSFTKLVLGQPRDFAIKYTLGNIIAICSTAFIIGPMRQVKNMSASHRWLAALLYLGAMVLTLVSAFYVQNAFVTLLCILAQFCAMVWYVASYIPFGRRMIAKFCDTALESG